MAFLGLAVTVCFSRLGKSNRKRRIGEPGNRREQGFPLFFLLLPVSGSPALRFVTTMSTFALTVLELQLLHQATRMAGDRLARQDNLSGSRVMDTLLDHLETAPTNVWLNAAQREVLGKMLMNIAYDFLRDNEEARSEEAEALAERLFQEEE
jgi:hypothetical protein